MYFLYYIALYSNDLDTEKGGRSRGFLLEYEFFRPTVLYFGGLELQIFSF